MNVTARDLLYRYVPALALVTALLLLVVLLPGNEKGTRVATGGTSAPAGGPGATTATRAGGAPAGPAGAPSSVPGVVPGAASSAVPGAVPGAGVTPGAATGGAPGAATGGTTSGGVATGGGTTAGGSSLLPPGAAPEPGASEGEIRPKVDPPPGYGSGCRSDGRQPGISRRQPSCVPLWTQADNGGATYKGVTADTVTVAQYYAPPNPATEAALFAAGVQDRQPDVSRIYQVLNRYLNTHSETYGRELIAVDIIGSGASEDAQRADAIKIEQEIGAFACLGCPRFASEELAARGILTIITFEATKDYYNGPAKGWVFGGLPAQEEHYQNAAEYWGKRLAGRNAKYAGTGTVGLPRKFGLIWIEANAGQPDPGTKIARDYFVGELAKWNITLAADSGYNLDVSRGPEQASNVIVKLKAAGVTTIGLITDALMTVFFTKEATRQAYFPEWFIMGVYLTDTTFFGRTYDQAQWRNAFGISPLWVFFQNVQTSDGYREFHHGCPGGPSSARCAPGDEGTGVNTYRGNYLYFFVGLSLAGPNLTPETFSQGMYSYPPTGGFPSLPLLFVTPESPTFFKDHTEVFWDVDGSGKDEVNKDGVGRLLKANGGIRYDLGEWPTDEPANDESKAIFTSDLVVGAAPLEAHEEQDGNHTHPPEQKCLSCRH